MLNTPILFLVFNRLDTTKQVFAKIREAKPKQLFIGADGAREGKEGEAEKVAAVRKYILDNIDWDCEVKTLFREQNLGCGIAPYQAITWFFDHVEQGIILEDDCLPDLSFFPFCEELLERYKDNERIMHVSGNNFLFSKIKISESYYFSKYTHNWGWATWKRAWKYMDFDLNNFEKFKSDIQLQKELFLHKREAIYWLREFETVDDRKNHIWDVQWLYSVWNNKGLSILPSKNLVSNIGFTKEATHTIQTNSLLSKIPISSISHILHPIDINTNRLADSYTFINVFQKRISIENNMRNILYSIFPKSIFNTWRKIKAKIIKHA